MRRIPFLNSRMVSSAYCRCSSPTLPLVGDITSHMAHFNHIFQPQLTYLHMKHSPMQLCLCVTFIPHVQCLDHLLLDNRLTILFLLLLNNPIDTRPRLPLFLRLADLCNLPIKPRVTRLSLPRMRSLG